MKDWIWPDDQAPLRKQNLMKRIPLPILSLLIGLSAPFAIDAVAAPDGSQITESKPSENAVSTAEGEIRKIDKDTGKVTIKHGDIKNLGMPPMTMVFRAKEPAMLDQVKVGDKVNFAVESAAGRLMVTKIEPKK